MASKAKSFRVNEEKKIITIYTNVDTVEAEKIVIEYYLGKGYRTKFEAKKPSITIDKMRKELEKIGNDKLSEFNLIYSGDMEYDNDTGFMSACGYYTHTVSEYKKEKRKKEREAKEAKEAKATATTEATQE